MATSPSTGFLSVSGSDIVLLYDTGGAAQDKVSRPVRVAVCRGQETRRSVQDLPEGAKLVLG